MYRYIHIIYTVYSKFEESQNQKGICTPHLNEKLIYESYIIGPFENKQKGLGRSETCASSSSGSLGGDRIRLFGAI